MLENAMREASAAWHAGDTGGCERALQKAMRIRPFYVPALRLLAQVHLLRGDTTRALQVSSKAVKASPRDGDLRLRQAECYELEGDGDGALGAYREAAKLMPNEPRSLCGEASVLERMHHLEEAQAVAERAQALFPTSPVALTMLAKILRRRGESARAERLLIDAIEQAEEPLDRYPPLFELAKLLDGLGRYDAAFERFTEANQAQAVAHGMDPIPNDPALAGCDDARSFSAKQFKGWQAAAPESTERVAFLFGFPRSGTTMTDRILGAHHDVVILEEQPTIREMHASLIKVSPDGKPIRDLYPAMDSKGVAVLRSAYTQAVRARLTSKQARRWKDGKILVIDKFPLQITAIASISRVLPDAKVMIALRDPRDVCLSSFMQSFSLNRSMAQLLDLQTASKHYNTIMGMWLDIRDRLALDWLEVRYEDTVTDFENQARKVLGFLGLQWSESLGEFHRHAPGTLVSTPSYEAVSKPINTQAIGRWKNYASHLTEMAEQLDPIVRRLGYEPL
ncbi:MAG: sulfotransferase family protein [Phycisphaera sp.]|nr:MAG: sulfotransferase family protein [Phycisphaera sp.]